MFISAATPLDAHEVIGLLSVGGDEVSVRNHRGDPTGGQTIIETIESDDREDGVRIRCPLCAWEPPPSSLWCCHGAGTPEAPFHGCDAIWNTFATQGRCPTCAHQWRWTSCLRCDGWSLHEDWYEHI
jgi:hypothetical protein